MSGTLIKLGGLKINIIIININIKIYSKSEIRILNIYLNLALRWKLYLRAVEAKVVSQLNTLKIITGSI